MFEKLLDFADILWAYAIAYILVVFLSICAFSHKLTILTVGVDKSITGELTNQCLVMSIS